MPDAEGFDFLAAAVGNGPGSAPHHIATLELSMMTLEIFADPVLTSEALSPCNELVRHAWRAFLPLAEREDLFIHLGKTLETFELELTWTANEVIRALNRDYRGKDEATDVLSFALGLESEGGKHPDSLAGNPWMQLPVLPLGSVFISLEWYYGNRNNTDVRSDGFARYVVERFIHGVLHLLGFHHDTMAEYQRVVDIQNRVVKAVFTGEEL